MIVIGRWLTFLALFALPAGAAVTLTPPAPTAADVITARIEVVSGCTVTSSTSIAGNVVRTDVVFTGCIAGPPPFPEFEDVTFGPLPAGAYTYVVYFQTGGTPFLHAEVRFLVQPLAIPTVDVTALIVLAFGIIVVALFLLRT